MKWKIRIHFYLKILLKFERWWPLINLKFWKEWSSMPISELISKVFWKKFGQISYILGTNVRWCTTIDRITIKKFKWKIAMSTQGFWVGWKCHQCRKCQKVLSAILRKPDKQISKKKAKSKHQVFKVIILNKMSNKWPEVTPF